MASDFRLKEQLPELTQRIVDTYTQVGTINHLGHCPLPNYDEIIAATDDLKEIIFPGYRRRERLHRGLEARASVRLVDLQAHRSVREIDRPALIIHDIHDREVPWDEGERYARFWPASRMLSTTGLGHRRILGDTSVIGSILDFVRGGVVGERVVSTPDLPFGLA